MSELAPATGARARHAVHPVHPDQADQRLRVVFLLRLRSGAQDRFLRAYDTVRWEVAGVPGHVRDQVCQSLSDPDQWLITSEWVSARHFLDWERSPQHRALAAPMMACVEERQSLRFAVRASTPAGGDR
jgi:heme-degrading monooxygenase HmoA